MAAPDPEERKLIEHCKNYIVACGILRGIQYENIASMQDAIKKIADAYQVDLTVGEGRMKFRESCRKAATRYVFFRREQERIKLRFPMRKLQDGCYM